MRNPWLDTPTTAPFVLEEDAPHVEAFNRIAASDTRLRLHVLPEPFVGNPRRASVIVLQLNPGYSGREGYWHRHTALGDVIRANFSRRPSAYPLFCLDPKWSDAPGGRWWQARLRQVIDAVGDAQQVSRQVAVVEFHGYHSRKYRSIPVTLPSQHYGFSLVRDAVARGALIVAMRAFDPWRVAVPDLNRVRVLRPRTPRSAYLTEANLGRATFRKLVAAIDNG